MENKTQRSRYKCGFITQVQPMQKVPKNITSLYLLCNIAILLLCNVTIYNNFSNTGELTYVS